MNQPSHCLLTGFHFDKSVTYPPTTETVFEYQFSPVGKVKIALPTLIQWMNDRNFNNPIIAGICRNAFENDMEPPLIDHNFLTDGIRNIQFPKSFKEKCHHLLKFMYDKGGNDFKDFNFNSNRDYPLCFADDQAQFRKIMGYLEENYLLKWKNALELAGGMETYRQVQLTDNGIDEVEKDMPKIPLIGLVNQEISTGDIEIDKQLNHAKRLFFQEPQTKDRMRSACEVLSYILEPLHDEVKQYFTSKDINDFFQIVNSFDIRHNKNHTKDLEHPEQYEWIFYSFLNTINTYTKIRSKLSS